MRIITIIFACLLMNAALAQKTDRLLIESVNFNSASAELTPDDKLKLETLVLRMKDSSFQVKITGHTDSIGNADYNLTLGRKRAEAVKMFLISKGIDRNNITATSAGEDKPLETNSTETGRAANRRVEITCTRSLEEKKTGNYSLSLAIRNQAGHKVRAQVSIMTQRPDAVQIFETSDTVITVKADQLYRIKVDADSYRSRETDVILKSSDKITSLRKEIVLDQIEVKQVLSFEKIHFLPNQAVFAPGAEADLKLLLDFMQQDTSSHIEILGHINYATYQPQRIPRVYQEHYILSLNRAKAVYNYLVQNGVNPGRMTYKGMNNLKMLVPDAVTIEDAMKNMRVEILVVK